MFGDRPGGGHRDGFQVTAIHPTDDGGPGIPDLEPAAGAGAQHFHLAVEPQGGQDLVTGAGA